ncbi:MAG: S-methyl-5'-thioadenosine phosphorylase [Acidimicrobiales bacterium]
MEPADIAVIGGSGFYRLLDDATAVEVETPFGRPSSPITFGSFAGRPVAFLARHGERHHLAPHAINSRANLWALRDLGVTQVFGPCAAGSLRPEIGPGDLVVLDQLVDRTWGRPSTFLDGGGASGPLEGPGTPVVEHVGFADPYCPTLRGALISAASGGAAGACPHPCAGWPAGAVHERGTVVVIQGPRFSTRAESNWYAGAGATVINMTQYPEAYLARELGMCYAGVALVTDRDAGAEGGAGAASVTMAAAMEVLAANVGNLRALLCAAIAGLPVEPACACRAGGARTLAR